MSYAGKKGERGLKKLNNAQIQGSRSPGGNGYKGFPTTKVTKPKNQNSKTKNNFKSPPHKKPTHRDKLNCIHLNADTLTNKLSELNFVLKDLKPDIVGISEVLPKNYKNIIHPEYFIMDGYTMETNIKESNDKHVRGCIMYVKNGIDYKVIDIDVKEKRNGVEVKKQFEEHVTIEINLAGNDKLLCSTMYRRGESTEENNEILLKTLEHITHNFKFSHLVVMGDFNVRNIDWVNTCCLVQDLDDYSNKFLECMRDSYLFQHVTEPTRQRGNDTPSTIDLIFSNEENMISDINYLSPLGRSDHTILNFNITCSVTEKIPQIKVQYEKGDYSKMLTCLKDIDWETELNKYSENIEKQWEIFRDKFNEIESTCIPRKKVTINGKISKKLSTPLDKKSLRKLKKKNKLWGKVRKELASVEEKMHYNRIRNQIRRLTRKSKILVEKNIAQNVKKNPKAFWKYTQTKLKTKSGIPDLERSDSTKSNPNYTSDDSEKADIFLSYFGSVFTEEPANEPLPYFESRKYNKELDDIKINEEIILKKLKKLKVNKSPGPDNIHPRVLHEVAEGLTLPLMIIFKTSIKLKELPREWKHANVSVIHKKGAKTSPKNYRPVSLTCIICKTLESIIRDEIVDHMKTNKLFSPKQFGFIAGRSCVLQLLHVLDIWTEILDQGGTLDVIYCDFMKAFDKVPHKRLVHKTSKYGITGNVLGWIDSFLSNRTQSVRINKSLSKRAPVTSGIPQGSVLGPLLFVIYINDLPEVVHKDSHVFLFADDTKVFRKISSPEDNRKLQIDIDNLLKWSETWMLKFHPDKCVSMSIGANTYKHNYYMADQKLNISHCEKDLGIHIDDKLNFEKHVTQAVNKANRIMAIARKTFDYMDEQTFKYIFKGLVRPHLEYGATIWNPHTDKTKKLIENVQRRATKTVPGLAKLSYEKRLLKLKLPTLSYRRTRGDVIHVYKLLNNGYDQSLPKLLKQSSTELRGHKDKLFIERAQKDIRKYFFSHRIGKIWNELPLHVIEAKDLEAFEVELDKHWKNEDLVLNFKAKIKVYNKHDAWESKLK